MDASRGSGMKRGTLEHFKTMRLADLLSAERPCDRAEALGLLEALCNHFAPRSAPQGNIGRCTNSEIAQGCGTSRNPDMLVHALVKSGWIDEHPKWRLVIHDWHEHADQAVRKYLNYHHLPFLPTSRRSLRKFSGETLDNIRPPRAGTGTGCISTKSTEEVETDTRARGWRTVPQGELLSDARRQGALKRGLSPSQVDATWAAFCDYEFDRAHQSVDRVWWTWCRNAVGRFAPRAVHPRMDELPGRERRAPDGGHAPLPGYDGGGAIVPRLTGIGKAMP